MLTDGEIVHFREDFIFSQVLWLRGRQMALICLIDHGIGRLSCLKLSGGELWSRSYLDTLGLPWWCSPLERAAGCGVMGIVIAVTAIATHAKVGGIVATIHAVLLHLQRMIAANLPSYFGRHNPSWQHF